MPATLHSPAATSDKSWLDRALTPFTDVRAGEGATALLMLANIFVLLICYSVIKTVREPLILLGGGAELRSYTAAGQAVALMGFVPLYSWFASRVNRVRDCSHSTAALAVLHAMTRALTPWSTSRSRHSSAISRVWAMGRGP